MKRLIIALFILPVIFSCTPARMAVSDDSLASSALKVDGRRNIFSKEKMQFGEYKTSSVKRSWVKGSSRKSGWGIGNPYDADFQNIISTEYIKKNQTIKFSLQDGKGNESVVYCVSKFNAQDLQVGNRPNGIVNIGLELFLKTDESESNYYVQVHTNKFNKPWELLIDNQAWQGKPKEYEGILSLDKDNYYKLVPVRQMVNKQGKPANILFGSVGFEIRDKNDVAVAAVSTLDKGVIYLKDLSAEQKFLMANVCAAILMQEQLG